MKLAKATTATFDDGTVVTLTPAVLIAVKFMLTPQSSYGPATITAIKFIRLSCGIGLRDAKDIVDGLRDNPELLA